MGEVPLYLAYCRILGWSDFLVARYHCTWLGTCSARIECNEVELRVPRVSTGVPRS